MADAGVDQYTFHIEPVKEVIKTCRKIKEAGMKVSSVVFLPVLVFVYFTPPSEIHR